MIMTRPWIFILPALLIIGSIFLVPAAALAVELPPSNHFRLWQLPTQELRTGEMYVSMSYVIQSQTGHLAVIDGGWRSDTDTLKNFLHNLGGQVDAWFITHQHPDHIGALTGVLEDMQNPFGAQVQIGQIYGSLLSEAWIGQYEPGTLSTAQEFNTALAISGQSVIEPVLGQQIAIDGLNFHILQLSDESGTKDVNNQSMVMRLSTPSNSILFLGDLQQDGGNLLLTGEFGDQLGSEYVQMSHHGNRGVNRNVYEAVHATYALWPTPEFLWNATEGSGYDTAQTRQWMEELGVEQNYVMKDGLIQLDITVAPEPSTWSMLIAGGMAILLWTRGRRRAST